MTTSAEIRQRLIETLQLDLVGPGPGHALESERLWDSEAPSRWYLTGFLVPTEAPESQRHDPESEEVLDAVVGSDEGPGDDDVEPDKAPARKVFLPSSLGISVLVPKDVKALSAEVFWGDYTKVSSEDAEHPDRKVWQRTQRMHAVDVSLPPKGLGRTELPDSRGVCLYVSARDVSNLGPKGGELPAGTRAISVFVVNERDPEAEDDEGHLFQAHHLEAQGRLRRAAEPCGLVDDDADERIADLCAATPSSSPGGVSTDAIVEGDACHEVRSTWIPVAAVQKVDRPASPASSSMEKPRPCRPRPRRKPLGAFGTDTVPDRDARRRRPSSGAPRSRRILDRCEPRAGASPRGLSSRRPARVEARLANRTMALRRASERRSQGWRPDQVSEPTWRPFHSRSCS